MILKQSSKIFQSYSPLYNNNQERTGENRTSGASSEEAQTQNLIKCLTFEDIQNPFSEDIVFNGQTIGKIEGLIEIKKIPLIKQIMCGIHTENGFDISSIYLHHNLLSKPSQTKGNSHREIPAELRTLISKKNNLLETFFPSTLKNLEEKQIDKEAGLETQNNFMMNDFNNDRKRNNFNSDQNLFVDPKATLSLLNDIKATLKETCKESLLIYKLIHQSDILLAQREMIDLGINLINILSKEDLIDSRRVVVFEILILLFSRAEIDLRLMAFDWKSEPSAEKLEVCRNFVELLNKMLEYCLEKLAAGKSADFNTNEFVEFFLSVAYFRIPIFRKIFITTINHDIPESESKEIFKILDKESDYSGIIDYKNRSDVNYSEYRNLQSTDNIVGDNINSSEFTKDVNVNTLVKSKSIEIVVEADNAIDINPVNSLIDWETLFYDRIEKHAKTYENSSISKELQEILEKMKETETIINSLQWKGRIRKRGNAFFSMIFRLEKYIQNKVIILRNMRWTKIPGFKLIINAIVHELKKREVALYQEPLVRLLSIFINDSDISNLFINTVIRRTK